MGKTPQKKPGKSIDQPDFSTSTFETLPAFDTTALQQLTKKVNVGLKQLEEDSKSSKKKRQHASKVDQKDKSKVATEPSALVPGKKRTINGTVKAVHKINGSNGTKIRSTSRGQETNTSNAPVKNSESNTNLIDEIRALGGDNEDLKLIVGVDSDSEAEAADFSSKKERTTNQQLQQSELQSFVKSLGINDLQDVEESPVISKPVPTQKREKPSNQKDRVKPKQHSVLTGTESHELKPVKSSKPAKSSKPGTSLEFEPRPDWHATQLPQIVARAEHKVQLPTDLSSRIYESAISLLEKENEVYASKHLGSNSSRRFLSTIMSSGTLSDKVSALTLVIQESPLHNIKAFESLIGLARKRSRGQAVTALGALKDLLADGTLLPSERRLRAFHLQPELAVEFINHQRWNQGDQLPGNLKVSHLLYWAYESWLKDRYFEILGILETWCNDEVQYARARAVGYVFELLKEKPEQESNLLRLLVNKLGDPDRKIASKTSYLLLQLQTSHPLMKQTIFSAIESELFRPGQSLHARYYAIITLNQTILSTKEDSIAGKLLDLYFSLFVGLLKRPDRAKAVKPPLTPTPAHTVKYNKRGDKQGGGSEKGKKALSREQLDEAAEKQEEDLNEKMISAVLTGVNRAIPFSNLDTSRFSKHLDTLFRITHSSNFNTSIQALILIQQLTTILKVSNERFYRVLYESLLDPRIITSSKQTMYLNLLFRALRDDLNLKRVKAFVKRLIQTLTLHQPPFICGVLYLIKHLEDVFPSILSMTRQPELRGDNEDEEIFHDVDDTADVTDKIPSPKIASPNASVKKNIYDGKKRDPEYSGAEYSCLWELTPFLHHFHPSVNLFATRLMEGGEAPMKPDFASHTLLHFLDRFIYRSARSTPEKSKGSSIMQPLQGTSSASVLLTGRSTSTQLSVNSEQFWRKQLSQVAVDEVFFHQYFTHMGKSSTTRNRQEIRQMKQQNDRQEKEDGDDENEDEIWKALVDSRPEVEGDMSSDDDIGFEDSEEDLEDYDDDTSEVDIEGDGAIEDDSGNSDIQMVDEDTDLELEGDGDSSEIDNDDTDGLSLSQLPGKNTLQRSKRRKLKNLPTFASAEDYAELLAKEVDGREE